MTKRLYPRIDMVKSTPPKDGKVSPAASFVVDRALLSARPPRELSTYSDVKFLAEVLFILRPLVYGTLPLWPLSVPPAPEPPLSPALTP